MEQMSKSYQADASFDAVMGYLHSIPMTSPTKKLVYHQLQMEVSDEHRITLEKRLREIATLTKGWDGYDGVPVRKATIKNMGQLFASCKASELADWSLAPTPNGTLLLERQEAAISVASKEFSYYAEQKNRYMEANHCEYSLDALRKTIQHINSFLSA